MSVTRRELLLSAGLLTGGMALESVAAVPEVAVSLPLHQRVRYCLNASTVMGQKLPLEEFVDLAAKAGYQGIEPWTRDIQAYVDAGKSLPDLAKRIADHGLRVESTIGFAHPVDR